MTTKRREQRDYIGERMRHRQEEKRKQEFLWKDRRNQFVFYIVPNDIFFSEFPQRDNEHNIYKAMKHYKLWSDKYIRPI